MNNHLQIFCAFLVLYICGLDQCGAFQSKNPSKPSNTRYYRGQLTAKFICAGKLAHTSLHDKYVVSREDPYHGVLYGGINDRLYDYCELGLPYIISRPSAQASPNTKKQPFKHVRIEMHSELATLENEMKSSGNRIFEMYLSSRLRQVSKEDPVSMHDFYEVILDDKQPWQFGLPRCFSRIAKSKEPFGMIYVGLQQL
jgi:hypothetical protein